MSKGETTITGPVDILKFGPFWLIPNHGVLLKEGRPVRLGSRAFDILVLLARNAGRVLSKQELMDNVWPGTAVVEANLSVHMAGLRRALDTGQAGPHILTVSGRGYRFVSKVEVITSAEKYPVTETTGNIPFMLTRLIGRDQVFAEISKRVAPHRLLTIVGSGGVGKTALALNIAENQLPHWRHGAWLIDFSPFSDPDLVCAALATVLGLEIRSQNPTPALVTALHDKEMLLVFDNCEHLIEPIAALAYAILQSVSTVGIIATSREPLMIPGELVHRLEPLEVPSDVSPVGAVEALAYSSVALLRERALAVIPEFEIRDEDALAASLICRKLAGVPLAIEFASALIPSFGISELASRLDDRMRLLRGERRAAAPRHRTLMAALDWSYRLLTPAEQLVLRRLGIFSGGFTTDAADAVLSDPDRQLDVPGILTSLVLKSLIAADLRDNHSRFRLLETTRAFALERMEEEFERLDVERRHAEYFARLLHGKQGLPSARTDYTSFTPDLDNIRAALQWAMSDRGNHHLAVSIAAGSLPIWFGLSLFAECGSKMRALFEMLPAELRDTPEGQSVHIATIATDIFSRGTPADSYDEWTKKAAAAEARNDIRGRVRLLIARWTYNVRVPDYLAADEQSLAFEAMALSSESLAHELPPADDPYYALVAPESLRATTQWMRGTTLHHMGRLDETMAPFLAFLREETPEFRTWWMAATGFDRRSDTLGLIGLTKCERGDLSDGMADAESGIVVARETKKALALCQALQWSIACRFISAADVTNMSVDIDEMTTTAEHHSLTSHLGMAQCFAGCQLALQGRYAIAAQQFQHGLENLDRARYGVFKPIFVGVLASVFAAAGQVRDGLRLIEQFELKGDSPIGFGYAEYLRRKAQLLMLVGRESDAEDVLRRAVDIAKDQGAVLNHVRVVTDLYALCHEAGRRTEAISGLRGAVEAIPTTLQGRHRERAEKLLAAWQ
ncbi:ATP-binding protein [Bradyrhizobium sp. 33ap4]|uniref:ATP-binding protein n=1 Tax=Bradyrhizobium sp. 33ap4 TaxID=3061630 RepID=UPI00292CC6B9|nr:winged helix-turn-helix domain-containing protein [Bradyrhizobium sp. 33ap4]